MNLAQLTIQHITELQDAEETNTVILRKNNPKKKKGNRQIAKEQTQQLYKARQQKQKFLEG